MFTSSTADKRSLFILFVPKWAKKYTIHEKLLERILVELSLQSSIILRASYLIPNQLGITGFTLVMLLTESPRDAILNEDEIWP